MNKNSAGCVLAMVAGLLVMSGCASTGVARTDQVTASPAATPVSSAPIPKDAGGKPVVRADSKEDFAAIAAAIRQQMQAGGRWQYMDQSERHIIQVTFDDMGRLYDQFGTVDKMSQNAKVQLLADQSNVNAILTRRDGDRLICTNEIPVGSHLPIKTCRTYAQVQAEQRNAQESLRVNGATMQKKIGH